MLIEQWIRRITIDGTRTAYELEWHDGTIHRVPATGSSLAQMAQDFAKTTYDTVNRTIRLVTPSGQSFEVEVYDPEYASDQRAGRPVIYLDQNIWVRLAQTIHSPHKVHKPELAAAEELIRLAEQRRVILPLSSGHLVEVARLDGARRLNLALLMLRLSRGWSMSHPMRVGRAEIHFMFGGSAITAADVFTLDPAQFYDDRPEAQTPVQPDAWSNIERLMVGSVPARISLCAVFLENKITREPEGVEAALGWADWYQSRAEILHTHKCSTETARKITRALFLIHLGADYEAAVSASGLTAPELVNWFDRHSENALAALPYLGRMRDVMHSRLLNPEDRWKPNDLIDTVYLPCATGYGNFVVADNQARHHLTARRYPAGAKVVSNLRELIPHLRCLFAESPR